MVMAQRVMTITLPWSFVASMLMTILLGSTISPLATVRHSLATMATSSTADEPVDPPNGPGAITSGH
eukprot:1454512-Amphidinium_carterae.1